MRVHGIRIHRGPDGHDYLIEAVKDTSSRNTSKNIFYLAESRLHVDLEPVHWVSNGPGQRHLLFPGELNSSTGPIQATLYAAPRHILPYHLRRLTKTVTKTGVRYHLGEDTKDDQDVTHSIWVFADAKHLKLYPFSIVVWPPAIRFFDEILDILRQNYVVIYTQTLSMPTALLLPFVLDLYRGDRRCDKSQLPRKCRYMSPYPTKVGYVKFLVPKADLDRNRVSQTAVDIKALLRRRYIPKIRNYVHDIICHISDNASHSREMEHFVKEYAKGLRELT